MRAMSREIDLCFRLGGDEFCVLLTNSTEDEARRVYCERLRRLLAERSQHLGSVSLSIGIAQTGPETFDEPDELIKHADKAMYDAKRSRKTLVGTPDATAA
jgi:diguanylate cyclase (GGDEF)-like protein